MSWFWIKYEIKVGSNIRSHNFWGRGGACGTVPWKENTRTSRDEERYGDGDGDGDGVGHVLPFHGKRTQGQAEMRRDMGMGMGMGWGMCYRSMEGEHKDKQR